MESYKTEGGKAMDTKELNELLNSFNVQADLVKINTDNTLGALLKAGYKKIRKG